MLIIKVIIEGLGLGFLLYLICAIGIRKGAIGMVHMYSSEVQRRVIDNGLTTAEEIKRRSILFKALCIPGYFIYVLVCAYAVNGARGFVSGFLQMFAILSIMNLIDRILVDGYWVVYTDDWNIPGTEDLKPYITSDDKKKKWIFGTVGMAIISAILSGIMCLIIR